MPYEAKNIYASTPATTRGKPFFLGGDPKGKNFLYTCGSSVVIRDIENPLICDLYDEHQRAPTRAEYAPSGYYIASGDSSGTIRIWDTTQKEHPLKAEFRVLGSAIYDIAWSPDSKRIIVGGDGREKYGHAFFWDTGASVGEISGHAKPINSVSFKPSRPYRVITGSEDFAVNWYEGPPFKYKGNRTSHSRFVNCVRFAPDGSLFASVGSDKNGFFYDGKTGEQKHALADDGKHTGGIYCCSWSGDSKKLLTASADRSCKIWDVETGKCITTFQFEKTTENQQLGCLWQGDYLLSVNLAGDITYLDQNNASSPQRVLKGHNKFVTALAYDKEKKSLYSGSYDSVIVRWNEEDGSSVNPSGKGHSNTIAQMSLGNGNLVTGSMDDSVRITPLDSLQYASDKIGVDSPVAGVASADNGTNFAASMKSIYVIKSDGSIASTTAVSYTPKSIAALADGSEIAVGGDDNKVHVYGVSGSNISEKATYEQHRDTVDAVQYSPNSQFLASAGKDRNVIVWDRSTGESKVSDWCFHSSRINSIAWTPDSQHVASGALDQDIYVWSLEKPSKRVHIKGAHRGGTNVVYWIDDTTLASCGQDCTVKTWNITHV